MNVASLELCKELYKLSGWDETASRWGTYADSEERWLSTIITRNDCPAYDLGYLLTKIPSRWWLKYRGRDYVAKWDDHRKELLAEADTPEDAVCKLAIDLFKQGVLKPAEPRVTEPEEAA